MAETRVAFDGGPMDGVTLGGLYGLVIGENDPPFTCMEVDGIYEHYVKVDDCECGFKPCYVYAGTCRNMEPHPPCGHDHGGDYVG